MVAVLNERFFPLLLSDMVEPLTIKELDDYFRKVAELADTGIRTGTRYAVIVLNDPMQMSALGRKQVAEVQARYLTRERNDVALAAYVRIESILARGAVTAISWISPEIVRHVQAVPSLEVALQKALQALEAHGTPFTGDLAAVRDALGLRLGSRVQSA